MKYVHVKSQKRKWTNENLVKTTMMMMIMTMTMITMIKIMMITTTMTMMTIDYDR